MNVCPGYLLCSAGEIVTGERPRRGSLRPPRVPQECPQQVADLIVACISPDPDDRPTAQQAMAQLGKLLRRGGGGGGGAGAGAAGGGSDARGSSGAGAVGTLGGSTTT